MANKKTRQESATKQNGQSFQISRLLDVSYKSIYCYNFIKSHLPVVFEAVKQFFDDNNLA